MRPEILVVYASKHGSTHEVATVIWEELDNEFDVEVKPAGDVRDLTGVRAVVLGGSIYMGRWHSEALHFLKKFRRTLSELPVAVFALGPRTLDESDVEASRKQLEHALAKVPAVAPRTVAIFGGVVDPAKLHFPLSHMPKSDVRDWGEIREWARGLPEVLDLVKETETLAV
jgi:menaquinone-dependent protoporphyrinogen oxidase